MHKKLDRRLERCRIIVVAGAVDPSLHTTIQDEAEPSRLWSNLLQLSWGTLNLMAITLQYHLKWSRTNASPFACHVSLPSGTRGVRTALRTLGEKRSTGLQYSILWMTPTILLTRLRSAFRVAQLGIGAILASGRSRLINLRREAQPPPRDPYVQNVSASSAVIAWVSKEPSVGIVEYGESPSLRRKGVDERVTRRHAVAVSGLDPGSRYFYRVKEAGGESEIARFAPPPKTRTPTSPSP